MNGIGVAYQQGAVIKKHRGCVSDQQAEVIKMRAVLAAAASSETGGMNKAMTEISHLLVGPFDDIRTTASSPIYQSPAICCSSLFAVSLSMRL